MSTPQVLAKFNQVLINPALLLIFSIAFFYFLWGVFRFVTKADDEKARETGLRHIFWGIIGMAIIVSARGIYAVVANTINAIH